jgi:hypothetical protein
MQPPQKLPVRLVVVYVPLLPGQELAWHEGLPRIVEILLMDGKSNDQQQIEIGF